MFLFNNWQNLTCGTVIGLKANLSELDIPSVKVVSVQERYKAALTLENKKYEFETITLFRRRRVEAKRWWGSLFW